MFGNIEIVETLDDTEEEVVESLLEFDLCHRDMELLSEDLEYAWFFMSAKKLCRRDSDKVNRLLGS